MKRLAAVVVIASAGFAGALVAFGDAARRSCVIDATPDAAYSAEFDEALRMGESAQVVRITRDERPVTDAWVCVAIQPEDTPGAGVAAEARELAAGRYEVPLDLTTPGSWEGRVLVEDGRQRPVAIPVTVDVARDD